jgi:hypothetical protein
MIKRLFLSLCVLLGACTLAVAQFADQATYAGTGAGTANAQTVTLPNATSLTDLLGVIVKYVPGATNTGAATLTVNSLAATAFRKPTNTGLAALTGGEIVSGQPVWLMYDGTFFDILSATNDTLTVAASNLANSALNFGVPVNLQLNGTVATNALTVAIKGNNGSDPSASNPVLIPFRSTTIGTGAPVIASLQAALSFTINSGSTMGCTNALACRLWILAINSGTDGSPTVTLCAMNASVATQVYAINEGVLQTSQSGTGGGNSAGLVYCGVSAVTSKPIRILGYMELTETTAGTWATNPTFIQLFGPGINKPGDVVQSVYMSTATPTSDTGTSFVISAVTQAITPTSAANLVKVAAFGTIQVNNNGTAGCTAQVQRGSTGIGQPTQFTFGATVITNPITPLAIGPILDQPSSISSQTYAVYFHGTVSIGCTIVNGGIIVEEIMGALPEPANDNVAPRRMVG